MKQLLFTIIILSGLNICCSAQIKDKHAIRTSARLMIQANRLQSKGYYLEAMDSATLALSYNKNLQTAANFVRNHWDKAMKYAKQTLSESTQMNNYEQSKTRLTTYRQLIEINSNLNNVHLPLHGPKNKWVWQPEIEYWDGHFSEEQKRFKRLQAIEDLRLQEEAKEQMRLQAIADSVNNALSQADEETDDN